MLRPTKLFWKLFLGTSLLAALVLTVCTWLILNKINWLYEVELTRHLTAEANMIRSLVEDRFERWNASELERMVKACVLHDENGIRITMILPDGTVLADSEAEAADMENHRDRPEVQQARMEGWGSNTRYSHTVHHAMKYVAVRIGTAQAPEGIVRVSMRAATITEHRDTLRELVWGIALLTLVVGLVLASGLSALWSRPIQRVTALARRLSRGDLSVRAKIKGADEVADLAQSLNAMRAQSLAQFHTIDRQRRTLDAVVNQLHEGVVAADTDGRVLLINPAAIRLMRIAPDSPPDPDSLRGQSVEQCLPNYRLQQMLTFSGRSAEAGQISNRVQEARLTINGTGTETVILARAMDIALPKPMPEEDPTRPPAQQPARLVVLMDVTALQQLVQVKTDFAANASHELRTPLAAIRAAVETLLHTGSSEEGGTSRRFLEVIERQAGRMEEMVADLLDLSRIESGQVRFEAEAVRLVDTLAELRSRHDRALTDRQISWQADVDDRCREVTVNPYLLRTVLNNLIDNAIKFTDRGGRLSIACRAVSDTDDIAITVADTGRGIPTEELERVFERFYQIDKSRGGLAAGTGLGLSIVRHAVAAMGGRVTLESTPGHGTEVTVIIPRNL